MAFELAQEKLRVTPRAPSAWTSTGLTQAGRDLSTIAQVSRYQRVAGEPGYGACRTYGRTMGDNDQWVEPEDCSPAGFANSPLT